MSGLVASVLLILVLGYGAGQVFGWLIRNNRLQLKKGAEESYNALIALPILTASDRLNGLHEHKSGKSLKKK